MARQLMRWLHPLVATLAGRRLLCELLGGPELDGCWNAAGGPPGGVDARHYAEEAALRMLESAADTLQQAGAVSDAEAIEEPGTRWAGATCGQATVFRAQLRLRHDTVRLRIVELARLLRRSAELPQAAPAPDSGADASAPSQPPVAALQPQLPASASAGESPERQASADANRPELGLRQPASPGRQAGPSQGPGQAARGPSWLELCIMQLPYFDNDVAKDVRSPPGARGLNQATSPLPDSLFSAGTIASIARCCAHLREA